MYIDTYIHTYSSQVQLIDRVFPHSIALPCFLINIILELLGCFHSSSPDFLARFYRFQSPPNFYLLTWVGVSQPLLLCRVCCRACCLTSLLQGEEIHQLVCRPVASFLFPMAGCPVTHPHPPSARASKPCLALPHPKQGNKWKELPSSIFMWLSHSPGIQHCNCAVLVCASLHARA